MITNIYRIKTRNSIYEIQVSDTGESRCCKVEKNPVWRTVQASTPEYLEQLAIGPSFSVPGVVDTSNVEDYSHFVLSTEPKRKARSTGGSGIAAFFQDLAEHVKVQAGAQAVMVQERPVIQVAKDETVCGIDGCTFAKVPGLPRHEGFKNCKSGSIASGGTRSHCACDACY